MKSAPTIEPHELAMPAEFHDLRFVDKQILQRLVAQTFGEMGIGCAPVAAERLQAMAAAQPAGRSLSQTIVDLREE